MSEAIKSYKYEGFGGDIAHGFFTRLGGRSTGVYEGLNVGVGSNDDPAAIQANRAAVIKALGADHIHGPYQIHSDICHTLTAPWPAEERPEGDALVTDQPGVLISVVTADCAPVLLVGKKADGAPVVGAAHAGWKGAVGGVLQNTLNAMQILGADLDTIKASIGPCIAKKSYEVDEGFLRKFLEIHENFESFFGAGARTGHYQFDLEGFCTAQLATAGVKTVHAFGLDTYANETEFFSYRRTTHKNEPDYGRQISAIMITE